MTGKRLFVNLGIFSLAAAVTCTLFINYCAWIYACGCQSLWAAADRHCNIHNPAGRHCPFCAHGATGYSTVLALILIPQFVLSWWPFQWDWRMRLMLALLAFPAAGLIAAVTLGWLDGYWAA